MSVFKRLLNNAWPHIYCLLFTMKTCLKPCSAIFSFALYKRRETGLYSYGAILKNLDTELWPILLRRRAQNPEVVSSNPTPGHQC